MPTPTPSEPKRPAVDEWGVYDPERAGLVALYTRLSGTPRPPAGDQPKPEAVAPALPLPKTPPDR